MKIKFLILMSLCLFLLPACDRMRATGQVIEESLNELEGTIENQAGRPVEAAVKIGAKIGLLAVSINHRGEVEIAIVAETPDIPTPLGRFSAGIQAEIEFPEAQTLTVIGGGDAWIYDLNDQPFSVELNDVDATISGSGDGNLVIEIDDRRMKKGEEPRFQYRTPSTFAMNREEVQPIPFDIGSSVNGQPIMVTQIGSGVRPVVLVGGMHAGFAPASTEIANRIIDHYRANPDQLPENISLYVIPVANPDSLAGRVNHLSGRINGNGVDINRNWDCNWSQSARWLSQTLDPGSEPFSEPENRALRDFFLATNPEAVVFWEAKGDLVIPGRCGNSYHSDSQHLASVYSARSAYEFGFITGYQITGDATDWLDKQGIAAIAVLLSDYNSIDIQRNIKGVQDILEDVAR